MARRWLKWLLIGVIAWRFGTRRKKKESGVEPRALQIWPGPNVLAREWYNLFWPVYRFFVAPGWFTLAVSARNSTADEELLGCVHNL
jgi:hypothetical protein